MKLYIRSFCLVTLVVVTATPAVSQQAEEDIIELEEIVVTGELQERTLQDTPTSVAVATGEELEARADVDIIDFVERTPNVSSSFGEKGFAIRGVDQRGAAGRAALISTQVDGIALPGTQSTFFGPYSTWDVSQVEVLRGPQSTQQGRNALGGAIIIRSNDPEFEPLYKFRAEVGSRKLQRYSAVINQPLIEDKLAFRFSADRFQEDGSVDNPTRDEDDYDARESTTYRAKLRWQATEDLEINFAYTYADSSGGEDTVEEPPFPGQRLNFSNAPAKEGSTHNIYGLRANWTINETLTLESETTYYTHDYVREEDSDQSALPVATLSATGESTAFEQDLRLRFDADGIDGIVGLFYSRVTDDRPSTLVTDLGFVTTGTPIGVQITRFSENPETEKNIAIFGEADIAADRWLPGLTFTLGARYDYEDYSFESRTSISPAVLPATDTSGSTTYQAFLPKIAATYEYGIDQAVSFTIQRGYRAGGAQTNAISGQLNEYDPEFTTNYELAYRGQFYDGNLRVKANAYYADWDDQQVSVRGDSGIDGDTNIVNAGRSKIYGAELLFEADPTYNLGVFATVGYARTKFVEFINNGVDLSGNSFPGAPEWTGALGATYAWDNGVTLGVDASYTDASFANVDNTPEEESDSRWLLNARVTYETAQGWLTGLYVRNLLDEDYATQRLVQNGFNNVTGAPQQITRVRAGEPRTVGFFVSKTF